MTTYALELIVNDDELHTLIEQGLDVVLLSNNPTSALVPARVTATDIGALVDAIRTVAAGEDWPEGTVTCLFQTVYIKL